MNIANAVGGSYAVFLKKILNSHAVPGHVFARKLRESMCGALQEAH